MTSICATSMRLTCSIVDHERRPLCVVAESCQKNPNTQASEKFYKHAQCFSLDTRR